MNLPLSWLKKVWSYLRGVKGTNTESSASGEYSPPGSSLHGVSESDERPEGSRRAPSDNRREREGPVICGPCCVHLGQSDSPECGHAGSSVCATQHRRIVLSLPLNSKRVHPFKKFKITWRIWIHSSGCASTVSCEAVIWQRIEMICINKTNITSHIAPFKQVSVKKRATREVCMYMCVCYLIPRRSRLSFIWVTLMKI